MRQILLGVTGSIAAYKAAELVRLFVKNGDSVTVVMTPAACEFVRPLTFQTLSRNPVFVDSFAPPEHWMPEHISLADEADLVLITPATANTIAKIAHGLADNLLTSTVLASRAPLVVAPAMNAAMYAAPATQDNLMLLRSRGVTVAEPDSGELACGTIGKGRLLEPSEIFRICESV